MDKAPRFFLKRRNAPKRKDLMAKKIYFYLCLIMMIEFRFLDMFSDSASYLLSLCALFDVSTDIDMFLLKTRPSPTSLMASI